MYLLQLNAVIKSSNIHHNFLMGGKIFYFDNLHQMQYIFLILTDKRFDYFFSLLLVKFAV